MGVEDERIWAAKRILEVKRQEKARKIVEKRKRYTVGHTQHAYKGLVV